MKDLSVQELRARIEQNEKAIAYLESASIPVPPSLTSDIAGFKAELAGRQSEIFGAQLEAALNANVIALTQGVDASLEAVFVVDFVPASTATAEDGTVTETPAKFAVKATKRKVGSTTTTSSPKKSSKGGNVIHRVNGVDYTSAAAGLQGLKDAGILHPDTGNGNSAVRELEKQAKSNDAITYERIETSPTVETTVSDVNSAPAETSAADETPKGKK